MGNKQCQTILQYSFEIDSMPLGVYKNMLAYWLRTVGVEYKRYVASQCRKKIGKKNWKQKIKKKHQNCINLMFVGTLNVIYFIW